MRRLLLLGLNHATAPLEVREKLAFSGSQRREALLAFKARFPDAEAVLLSTCNRVELYVGRAVHGQPRMEAMVEFLAAFHNLDASRFRGHLYERANAEVVEHLFKVASSLDSMVLGESQIIGQVREAYDAAREAGLAGNMLHPLFQRAVAVGRQVMTRTVIGDGRLSVASVAVEYARRIFEQFADKTVLSIGAGKMATLVLKHFADLKPGRLLVCNRDLGKAQKLAERFGGMAVEFDRLDDHLVAADVVVSSTGSSLPILTRARFDPLRRLRRYRPIFLIDIALPRDIEAGVGDFDNVYLYNIDHLQQVVSETQTNRRESVDAAKAIVASEVTAFAAWHRQRELGPMIEKLYARWHEVAGSELARTLNKLPNLDADQRKAVEDLARRIVNKVLHEPVRRLRQGDGATAANTPGLSAMEQLFGLNEPTKAGPDDEAGDTSQ